MSIGILLYLDLEFWEGTLKTLTPSLQENAKYFTTRSYLTLTIYPRLSRSSVYFRPFGYMSIVVYFEDGMRMVYDDLRKQAHITG